MDSNVDPQCGEDRQVFLGPGYSGLLQGHLEGSPGAGPTGLRRNVRAAFLNNSNRLIPKFSNASGDTRKPIVFNSAVVFRDSRVGWGMAVLTPSYLMYSTVAMSEPTLMALTMGGLLSAISGHVLAGGLLLGVAGLVRPVACFAVVGYMFFAFCGNKPREALIFGAVALAVVAAGVLAFQAWRGDAFEGVRLYYPSYGGELPTWPFKSLIMWPLTRKTTAWKIAYIWSHVAVTLLACIFAGRLIRQKASAGHEQGGLCYLVAPWLCCNTLYVLCVGGRGGFHEFHRFILPALPPLFWALRRWIPSSRLFWFSAALVSLVLGLWGVQH